jgi:hypothetical protein
MISLLIACTNQIEPKNTQIQLDTGLQNGNSFSIVYEGISFPTNSSITITTAPAGLQYQHQYKFQLSNHSTEEISLDCQQSWEDTFLYIDDCPDKIAAQSSAALSIFFSPVSEVEEKQITLPLAFPNQEYVLDIEMLTPRPLTTIFWGDSGYLLISSDYGKSVELYQQQEEQIAKAITFGNGLFLRASSDLSDIGIYESSEDGINWLTLEGSEDSAASGCSHGKELFVCSRADALSWSEDGQHIFHEQSMDALEHHDITYGQEQFVAVGRNGRRSISYDGQVWDFESSHGLGDDYHDVIYGEEHFVAAGGKDRFLVSWSTDGIDWQDKMFPPVIGARLDSVIYDGDRYIISGSGTTGENILYTTDFQFWDPLRQTDSSLSIKMLGYINQNYIGIGTKTNQKGLYFSGDGASWTLAHSLPSDIAIVGYAIETWSP